jgi:hypothetical protein
MLTQIHKIMDNKIHRRRAARYVCVNFSEENPHRVSKELRVPGVTAWLEMRAARGIRCPYSKSEKLRAVSANHVEPYELKRAMIKARWFGSRTSSTALWIRTSIPNG